jgi:hypothetical protein
MREGEAETVDRHPDSDTLLAFRQHRLSGSAVATIAHHVRECARCAKVEATAGRVVLDALVLRAADDHLSDEERDAVVEQRVMHPHLAVCAMCRAEVEDLRRFDDAETPSKRWWIAAAAAVAVLVLSAVALFVRRDAVSMTATKPAAPVAPVTVTQPAAPVVASLTDGAGRIALLADGTIAGVEPRSPRDADDIRAVLSGRAIAIPTFVAAMPGAVRGGSATASPFRAIAPFRTAVRDARPRFSWTPVRGARSYRVAVFDADYEEIARSEVLSGTSWTASHALPSGVDLSWHAIAETDAGEISSSGSDRTEAVFRVLTAKEAAEVDAGEAQYRDSHLLRGLLYSRHGLLHDAEREFRALAEQNPGSPIARQLIDTVSR